MPPSSLEGFLGQDRTRDNLRVFVAAARVRQRQLEHVLISGPAGTGKRTLAELIAAELGVKLSRAFLGRTAGDLANVLTRLESRALLFADEIGKSPSTVVEVLCPAMEHFRLDVLIGEGPLERTMKVDLPPFTLIATTTKPRGLSEGLRARFGIVIDLGLYDVESLRIIVEAEAQRLGHRIAPEAAREIAAHAGGTPRGACRLLPRVMDFAHVAGKDVVDIELARSALSQLVGGDEQLPNLRVPISDEVKAVVWRRDRGQCAKCGSSKSLEFDHVIPVVEGGSSTPRNLQLLCETCNRSKGRTI